MTRVPDDYIPDGRWPAVITDVGQRTAPNGLCYYFVQFELIECSHAGARCEDRFYLDDPNPYQARSDALQLFELCKCVGKLGRKQNASALLGCKVIIDIAPLQTMSFIHGYFPYHGGTLTN